MRPRLALTFTSPEGERFDATTRVALEGVGVITEAAEEDLLQLVHGDVELTADDQDGALEEYLRGGAGADTRDYEAVLERETGDTRVRRPRYERLFGGTLDLEGMSIDRRGRTIGIQAFSFTKLLERTSAEGVKRTPAALVGTTNGSNDRITSVTPDTDDIEVGDTVKLDDGDGITEEHVVISIDSSSQVTVDANWSNAFTGDTLTIETPYFRRESIAKLAGRLFDEASIDARTIDIDQALSSYPIQTEVATSGLPNTDAPGSIVDQGGKIKVQADTGDRYTADNPRDGFTLDAAAVATLADWTPYLEDEPATIDEGLDTNANAFDHTNGRRYSLIVNPLGGSFIELRLLENGSSLSQVDTYNDTLGDDYGTTLLEYDPINNDVWVSYSRGDGSRTAIEIYDRDGASWSTKRTGVLAAGQLRVIARSGIMVLARFDDDGAETFRLGDPGVAEEIPNWLTSSALARLNLWSLCEFGGFRAVLYKSSNEASAMRVRIWDTAWNQVADYTTDSAAGALSQSRLGRFTDGTEEISIGYAGDHYIVLSRSFAGVLPYADFSGKSVAGALRELAVVSMAYLAMGHYKQGLLRGRATAEEEGRAVRQLPQPVTDEEIPVWEFFRTSVRVRGATEAGVEIDLTLGETGESARRFEIDSQLITTTSLATAIGNAYLAYLGQARTERNATVREDGELVRLLDLVEIDGTRYLTIATESDLEQREQDLRLTEATT